MCTPPPQFRWNPSVPNRHHGNGKRIGSRQWRKEVRRRMCSETNEDQNHRETMRSNMADDSAPRCSPPRPTQQSPFIRRRIPSRYPRTGTTSGVSERDQPSTDRHLFKVPNQKLLKTPDKGTQHKVYSLEASVLPLSAGKENSGRTVPWPLPLGSEARGA